MVGILSIAGNLFAVACFAQHFLARAWMGIDFLPYAWMSLGLAKMINSSNPQDSRRRRLVLRVAGVGLLGTGVYVLFIRKSSDDHSNLAEVLADHFGTMYISYRISKRLRFRAAASTCYSTRISAGLLLDRP